MRKQAIVIGGSMAGMVTARILAEHFERVLIVDRDALDGDVTARPGVPQSHQIHVLLAEGRRILRQLFPTFDDALAAGTSEVDWLGSSRVVSCFGPFVDTNSGVVIRPVSRGLLERELRKLVRAIPNVQ